MPDIKPLSPILSLGKNIQNTTQQTGTEQNRSVVQGKVEADLGNNLFQVRVGNQFFQVQSTTQLNVGQQVRLALSPGQLQQGQVINNTAPAVDSAKQDSIQTASSQSPLLPLLSLITSNSSYSANSLDLSGIFTALFNAQNVQAGLSPETLNTLSLFQNLQQNFLKKPQESGKILENLVSLLGLNHDKNAVAGEATKATLKNSLLEILSSHQGDKALQGEATKILENLVFSQLSLLGAKYQDETVIPIPLSFIEKGFLQIKDVVDDNLHFSLNVQMSKIGNVNFSFAGNTQAIYLSIFTEDSTISDMFTQHKQTLLEALNTLLPIAGIRIEEGAEDVSAKLLQIITHNSSSSLIETMA